MTRRIILAGGCILVLVFAYILIRQISDALRFSERLSAQAETVYKLEIKNKQLKQKLSQIQTSEFVEQQARDKLGLSKPGETVVIIPQKKIKQVLGLGESAPEIRLPNWLGWWKVFFK